MTATDAPESIVRSTPDRIESVRLPLRNSFPTPVNSMRIRRLLLTALATLTAACGDTDPDRSELLRLPDSEGSLEEDTQPDAESVRVVFLGTSLTEGLGLDRPGLESWPSRVANLADSAGLDVRVMNAGLGGETSAGALRRLEWVMQQDPDVLVLETGANDGLRGLPVEQLESNLDKIIRRVQEGHQGVTVVVAQMEAPPNMGAEYAGAFREVFPRVAERRSVALIPFVLEGVAGSRELNQRDGIHPTAAGHWIMARNAWPVLAEVFLTIGAS